MAVWLDVWPDVWLDAAVVTCHKCGEVSEHDERA